MSTAALVKKSLKARFQNKNNDLTKLREALRQVRIIKIYYLI